MNRINHNNYREWVERFLDAETTVTEERELYAYFSRPDLPEEANKYRRMFGWYEQLPAQSSADTTAATNRVRILPLRPWQWAGVAAMIALLFTIGLSLRHTTATGDADDYIYASYVIVDGRKITDPEVVNAELARIESRINSYADAFDQSMDRYDHPDISIDTDNPELRNFIETSLKF